MRTAYFKEFIVFSNYLNITKAAAELNMSQSNLSKHLKQLERDLGFELISYRNNKLSLTAAGSFFLNNIIPIVNSLDDVIRRSGEISSAPHIVLNIQHPPYSDETALQLYKLIDEIMASDPSISIRYCHAYRSVQEDNLANGKIDLVVKYTFGDQEAILDKFSEKGLAARYLATVPIGIWCRKSNALAKRETVSVRDLSDIAIMLPNEPNTPLRDAWTELCLAHSFTPRFNVINAETQSEFYYQNIEDSVYILPSDAAEKDILFTARSEMAFIPLDQNDGQLKSYVVASTASGSFPYLEPFFAC